MSEERTSCTNEQSERDEWGGTHGVERDWGSDLSRHYVLIDVGSARVLQRPVDCSGGLRHRHGEQSKRHGVVYEVEMQQRSIGFINGFDVGNGSQNGAEG